MLTSAGLLWRIGGNLNVGDCVVWSIDTYATPLKAGGCGRALVVGKTWLHIYLAPINLILSEYNDGAYDDRDELMITRINRLWGWCYGNWTEYFIGTRIGIRKFPVGMLHDPNEYESFQLLVHKNKFMRNLGQLLEGTISLKQYYVELMTTFKTLRRFSRVRLEDVHSLCPLYTHYTPED